MRLCEARSLANMHAAKRPAYIAKVVDVRGAQSARDLNNLMELVLEARKVCAMKGLESRQDYLTEYCIKNGGLAADQLKAMIELEWERKT